MNIRDSVLRSLPGEVREEALRLAADRKLDANDPVWEIVALAAASSASARETLEAAERVEAYGNEMAAQVSKSRDALLKLAERVDGAMNQLADDAHKLADHAAQNVRNAGKEVKESIQLLSRELGYSAQSGVESGLIKVNQAFKQAQGEFERSVESLARNKASLIAREAAAEALALDTVVNWGIPMLVFTLAILGTYYLGTLSLLHTRPWLGFGMFVISASASSILVTLRNRYTPLWYAIASNLGWILIALFAGATWLIDAIR